MWAYHHTIEKTSVSYDIITSRPTLQRKHVSQINSQISLSLSFCYYIIYKTRRGKSLKRTVNTKHKINFNKNLNPVLVTTVTVGERGGGGGGAPAWWGRGARGAWSHQYYRERRFARMFAWEDVRGRRWFRTRDLQWFTQLQWGTLCDQRKAGAADTQTTLLSRGRMGLVGGRRLRIRADTDARTAHGRRSLDARNAETFSHHADGHRCGTTWLIHATSKQQYVNKRIF